jgi:hypothetical protein
MIKIIKLIVVVENSEQKGLIVMIDDRLLRLSYVILINVVTHNMHNISCHADELKSWTPKKLLRNQKGFYEIKRDLALVGNGNST